MSTTEFKNETIRIRSINYEMTDKFMTAQEQIQGQQPVPWMGNSNQSLYDTELLFSPKKQHRLAEATNIVP